jgi:hypothetical protein
LEKKLEKTPVLESEISNINLNQIGLFQTIQKRYLSEAVKDEVF